MSANFKRVVRKKKNGVARWLGGLLVGVIGVSVFG